jgi:hypothetical protein
MSDTTTPPSPSATDAPVIGVTFPLEPLPPGTLVEPFSKSASPDAPPPMRMMAARAMAPIPPKHLVPIIYALMSDPDPKIAAAATKTFYGLDEKLLTPALNESLPAALLVALAHVTVDRPALAEKVLLQRNTPDVAYVWVAERVADHTIVGIIVGNQERLLRTHDITRALSRNGKVLRSDLDRAVDFLVREGVFLDDVHAFEDSFLKLGKSEMLDAIKKQSITEADLLPEEREEAKRLGLTPTQYLEQRQIGTAADVEHEDEKAAAEEFEKLPFAKLSKGVQIKRGLQGSHADALEALKSTNRLVALAGIRNPKIKEDDVVKLAKSKTMHEEVIREICGNGDWTKAYSMKFILIQNPKLPPSLMMRWMPLLREQDLRALSRSKQVSSTVSITARRLLENKKS